MRLHYPSRSVKNSRGQSLVETALILPLLIMITLNVVNLGYFFLVAVNLTGAARTASLYAIEGGATPAAGNLASSGGSTPTTNTDSVTYLVYQDLAGALANSTGVTVQVCSQANLDSSGAVFHCERLECAIPAARAHSSATLRCGRWNSEEHENQKHGKSKQKKTRAS